MASNCRVLVQQQLQQIRTTTYVENDSPNHLLHCIITFFCPWWIFIWLIVCCVYYKLTITIEVEASSSAIAKLIT